MEKTLRNGLITAASAEIANVVSNSSLGTSVYDSHLLNGNYGLERFVNGATQAGAFAGLTVATYGATKAALKALPFVSDKTAKATGLTSAISVAYGLANTDVFQNAVYNMGLYDRQVAGALETIATFGIATGLVVASTLFAKDLLELAGSGIKKVFSKKE